jgi:hypothetical protein
MSKTLIQRLFGFALSAVLTFGMMGSIDHLAQHGDAPALMAKAGSTRA